MLNWHSCLLGRRAARGFALGAVIAGLAVAGCGGSSPGTPAANAPNAPSGGGSNGGGSGKTLNIAVVTDLTGTDAPARKPFNEGVVSFFKTYPSVGGKKFNIHIYDGQSNPAVGPSVFRQALSNNPAGLLDFTLSTSTAASAPIIAGAGVPCMCIGGPDAWYSPPSPKPWAFQANPSGAMDANGYTAGMAKLLGGSLKGKRIAVSGDNTSFLVTNEKDTEALAPKQGWTITTTQMGPYTEVSWSSEAAQIARTHPQGVFDITIAAPQIVQIKAMEAAGLSNVPMVLFPGLQYSDLMSLKLPNVYIVTPFPYGTAPGTGLYEAAKKYGYLSDEVSYEFALGWDQAATLREAMQKCGDCTGTALEKSLEGITNYTIPGKAAFGPITFSATNHAVAIHPELIHYDPGTHSLQTISIPSTSS